MDIASVRQQWQSTMAFDRPGMMDDKIRNNEHLKHEQTKTDEILFYSSEIRFCNKNSNRHFILYNLFCVNLLSLYTSVHLGGILLICGITCGYIRTQLWIFIHLCRLVIPFCRSSPLLDYQVFRPKQKKNVNQEDFSLQEDASSFLWLN